MDFSGQINMYIVSNDLIGSQLASRKAIAIPSVLFIYQCCFLIRLEKNIVQTVTKSTSYYNIRIKTTKYEHCIIFKQGLSFIVTYIIDPLQTW